MARAEYWWIDCRDSGMHWVRRLVGDALPLAEGKCTGISELPAPPGASLVVSIPGEKVRVHRVKLPRRNRRRFLASLPFVLEDRLLHAPENYHLTPFPTGTADTELPVAVVARAYLGPLLAGLQQQDWRLLMLCPDYCFLETPDAQTWVLDLVDTPMLLRFPGQEGGAVISGEPGQQPPGALLLALEQASVVPGRIQVITPTGRIRDMVAGWRDSLEEYGVGLEPVNDDRGRVKRLGHASIPPQMFNLLTGPYATRRRYGREVRRLIPLASLAAVLLLVLTSNWFIGINRLQQQHAGLQEAIEETYRGLFPDARNLVDPRFQMQQQLESLQRALTPADDRRQGFLQQLEQFASATEGMDARLLAMRYDENGLFIELSIPDYEVFEDLQSRLGATMNVTVENAELKDERVYSRLHLGGDA